jgi:multisubunit Na+/H+ antiporter MnhB subunit
MDTLSFLLKLHSGLRWLVVAVTIIALVWFLLVWLAKRRNEKADRALMGAFSGLIDLQVLVGIIYIIWSGSTGVGYPSYRIKHGVAMIIAAVVSHLSMRWRTAEPKVRARNNVILIVVVLALIFIGISFLPQGWIGS